MRKILYWGFAAMIYYFVFRFCMGIYYTLDRFLPISDEMVKILEFTIGVAFFYICLPCVAIFLTDKLFKKFD